MRLSVARRRGDFASVLDQVQPLLALAEPRRPDELERGNDLRAIVLMHLGVVELWAPGGRDDAERHLEQARALARRTGRPWIEVSSLGYAALAAARHAFALARRRADEAIAVAEAHGLGSHPVLGPALAVLGGLAAWQGRLDEAEGWLGRAGGIAQPDGELMVALLLALARGTLRLGQGRPGPALAALREAEQLHARLVTPHPLALQVRQLLVQTLVRLGASAEAREALVQAPEAERGSGEGRVALAWLRLAEAGPGAAVDVLAPVLDGSARALGDFTVVQARLLDAVARDRLGDGRAAQAALERALDLAEPNALVWPFLVTPVRELLDRHPRHGTAHAALLADVLDALAGSSPHARGGDGVDPAEELSQGELRVLRYLPTNLGVPEIAAELYLSTNTVKTHMRHIYAKLGVHRRTEAVERARGLGLLGPSARR